MKNIKCNYCSIESGDLCESCNTGYYPKIEESSNQYFDCFNNETISDGYYLNSATSKYEHCYPSCKKCTELGDINENKCTSCINGYSFIVNNDNKTNCYPNCSHYFYFDDNRYNCTIDDNCPTGYKLINSTRRCINNCIDDHIYNYNYEYNNVCYKECPSDTHILDEINKKCEADLICNSYYNYEHTGCISEIPEGFYVNSSEFKTIDKCHDNCKSCDIGGTDEQNNCKTCKDTGKIYFDLGNCREECVHNFFIYNNSIKTCKCMANISCHYCTEESMRENLCESCNIDEGYYPKSDDIQRPDGFIE